MIHTTKAEHIETRTFGHLFINVRQHFPSFFQKPLNTFDFFFSFHFSFLFYPGPCLLPRIGFFMHVFNSIVRMPLNALPQKEPEMSPSYAS